MFYEKANEIIGEFGVSMESSIINYHFYLVDNGNETLLTRMTFICQG